MKAHRIFSALLFALALAPAAHAVDVKNVAFGKGREVWFVEDHTLPMISMVVSFPAGSGYDPDGKDGLAAFAADMLNEGAGKYDSTAYQTALSDRAVRLGTDTGRDEMVVSLTTLTENAPEAFRLLGLALAHARFDQSAIERVRGQILAGIEQSEEDPGTVAARGFYRAFFRKHPYAHSITGERETVAAIGQADLRAFAQSHWVKSGLKIAVAGDVDQAALKPLLNQAFGALPATVPAPVPPVGDVGAVGMHVIAMPVPQPNVVFGMVGMLRSDPDFIPAYVANYILGGGGFSSRLTDQVREKRGLTYDIDTGLVPYRRAGLVLGQVASKRESVRQAVQVIRDTMKDFAANGPTDKELADAKTYLTGSWPLAFASDEGIAAQLNVFQNENLPMDYVDTRNDLVNAVTADDVQRAAKRLYNPSKMTVVVAGSIGPQKTAPAHKR